MFYVYLLQSQKDQTYYIGQTDNFLNGWQSTTLDMFINKNKKTLDPYWACRIYYARKSPVERI